MKRKLLWIAFALIVVVALVCTLSLVQRDAHRDTFEYTEIFEKALSVDGAASEAYAIELKELFDNKTGAFVTALNQENDKVISQVISFLIAETKTSELDNLTNYFAQYAGDTQYDRLLSVFHTHMDERLMREENQDAEPPETVQSYAFNPETIKKFIDLNLKLGDEGDDGYKQTVANAYLADPILFAETIQDYTPEEIDIILDSVSAGLKLLDKEPPMIHASDIETDIMHIIDTVQEKYNTP